MRIFSLAFLIIQNRQTNYKYTENIFLERAWWEKRVQVNIVSIKIMPYGNKKIDCFNNKRNNNQVKQQVHRKVKRVDVWIWPVHSKLVMFN